MPDDLARQAPVNAFIQKNSHEVDSMRRSFASSRNAMTCSPLTEGNPVTKSSIDSPASRSSSSVCTGTRVPANTGAPPRAGRRTSSGQRSQRACTKALSSLFPVADEIIGPGKAREAKDRTTARLGRRGRGARAQCEFGGPRHACGIEMEVQRAIVLREIHRHLD